MDGLGMFSFQTKYFLWVYPQASRTTASKESGPPSVFALAPSLVWSPSHLVPVMLAVVSVPHSPLACKAHPNLCRTSQRLRSYTASWLGHSATLPHSSSSTSIAMMRLMYVSLNSPSPSILLIK